MFVNFAFFLIGCLAFSGLARAAPTFHLSLPHNGEPVGLFLDIIEDDDAALDVGSLPPASDPRWQQSQSLVPAKGVYSGILWGRMNIQNPGPPVTVLMEARWAPGNHYSLHQKTQDGFQSVVLGDSVPFSRRNIPHRYPVFEVTLHQGLNTLIFRSETDDFVKLPLYLWSPKQFFSAALGEYLLLGFLLGIMLVMAGYNLFLYSKLRNIDSLYYVLYMALFSGFSFTIQGLGFQFGQFLPDYVTTDRVILLFGLGALIFATYFSTSYLSLKESAPGFYKNFRYFIATCVLGIPVVLVTNLGVGSLVVLVCNLWFTVNVLMVGTILSLKKLVIAYYFLGAWLFLLVGDLFMVVDYLVPIAEWAEWGGMVGGAVECVLISLGLGHKMSEIKKESDYNRQESNRLQQRIENARIIQDSLIRDSKEIKHLEFATYFSAAETMGGDWYSVFHDSERDYVYYFIGDVTGHGLSATLISGAVAGAIETSVRSCAEQRLGPQESLLYLANSADRILRSVGSGDHMTMAQFCVDLKSNKMFYLNAGHPPVYHRSGDKVIPLFHRGSPLGHYKVGQVREIQLREGDLVFAFTDGLTENSDDLGKVFKSRSIRKILGELDEPHQVVARILDEANDVWNGSVADDDCTMIAMKVREISA